MPSACALGHSEPQSHCCRCCEGVEVLDGFSSVSRGLLWRANVGYTQHGMSMDSVGAPLPSVSNKDKGSEQGLKPLASFSHKDLTITLGPGSQSNECVLVGDSGIPKAEKAYGQGLEPPD